MRGDYMNAFRADTGERAYVPRRWVDNPAIFGGRFVSTKPPKTSRAKREPVETEVAATAADDTASTVTPDKETLA